MLWTLDSRDCESYYNWVIMKSSIFKIRNNNDAYKTWQVKVNQWESWTKT